MSQSWRAVEIGFPARAEKRLRMPAGIIWRRWIAVKVSAHAETPPPEATLKFHFAPHFGINISIIIRAQDGH
jgi:hypothetical protein